jgi:RimJ/RimL family protein N-acetyltransferase
MTVELRPWRSADWPIAFRWARESAPWVFDDFAPTDQHSWIDSQIRRSSHDYAVIHEGELGGLIQGDRISPITVQVHFLFKRHFCTPEITTEAALLAKAEAWRLGYRKIWCLVDAENRAIIRLIKRVGGIPEGMLRRHVQKDGMLTDIAVFGIFRERSREWVPAHKPLPNLELKASNSTRSSRS